MAQVSESDLQHSPQEVRMPHCIAVRALSLCDVAVNLEAKRLQPMRCMIRLHQPHACTRDGRA